MQAGVRPYLTAGVALVGASVIAVTPVAAPPRDIHLPPVHLSAAIENPATVFAPALTAAQTLIATQSRTS